MDDDQFRKLLDHLGYCWAGYRKVRRGVKKRIRRHMQRLGCRDITDYLNLLDHQKDLRQECELLMTVSISRFFRDRQLWQLLEHQWLPDIIATEPAKMKVWSAGCACGEEVYSFKIVWEHLKKRFESLPELEVLATDRHPQYLGRARSGIYNLSSLKEVAPDVRCLFFKPGSRTKRFAIDDQLKDDIRWEIHHLLSETPGSDFNVIFLRNNVLTYYRQETRKRALTTILKCLTPGGLLIIGCHEILPFQTTELIPMAHVSCAFKKKE